MKTCFNTMILKSVLAVVLACSMAACQKSNNLLEWTAIDVSTPYSQADAHLLTFDATNHVLIDTGSIHSGEKLIRFLREKNCSSIQSVVITHGHFDHYGGLVPLLKSGMAIGRVYFNPPSAELVAAEPWGCSEKEISEIKNELQNRNIPLTTIDKDTVWRLGNKAMMRVICAFNGIDTPAGRTDINDTSAVIMLIHGNNRFLFAADINRAIGNYLTTNCPDLLRADILKFPHHGTEGFPDNSFFAAVNAKTFIVPAPKELWISERSARARHLTKDLKVYINGINGNITVVSDGNSFRIYPERSVNSSSSSPAE